MLSIKIKKTDHDNLVACVEPFQLIEFRYIQESNEWRFWLPGGIVRIDKGRAFSWDYFKELCRVAAFVALDTPLWQTADAKIVSGKSYIK